MKTKTKKTVKRKPAGRTRAVAVDAGSAIGYPECGSEAWKRQEIERMLDNDRYDRGQADWQAQCEALVADTRKQVALPSDACVILALAARSLLARRELGRLREENRALRAMAENDSWSRELRLTSLANMLLGQSADHDKK